MKTLETQLTLMAIQLAVNSLQGDINIATTFDASPNSV